MKQATIASHSSLPHPHPLPVGHLQPYQLIKTTLLAIAILLKYMTIGVDMSMFNFFLFVIANVIFFEGTSRRVAVLLYGSFLINVF